MTEWLRIEKARWEELDELARRLARISTDQKRELESVRARLKELEEVGRALIRCNEGVCAMLLPNRCPAQCQADAALRRLLRASPDAGTDQ
jgi:hypothetical protein